MAVRITRSKSSEKIGVGVPNGSPGGSGFPVRQESNRRTETAHMASNPPSPPTARPQLYQPTSSLSSSPQRMDAATFSRSNSHTSLNTLDAQGSTVSLQTQSNDRRKRFRALDRDGRRRPSSEEALPSACSTTSLTINWLTSCSTLFAYLPARRWGSTCARRCARVRVPWVHWLLPVAAWERCSRQPAFELHQEMNARAATHVAPSPEDICRDQVPVYSTATARVQIL